MTIDKKKNMWCVTQIVMPGKSVKYSTDSSLTPISEYLYIIFVLIYLTLKTDLCNNGWSRLIDIDHKLIMLDQPLGRDTSHDCAIKNPHSIDLPGPRQKNDPL